MIKRFTKLDDISRRTKVNVISENLTQAAFPQALGHPNIENLNNLLRIYSNRVVKMSLKDIAEKYNGEI